MCASELKVHGFELSDLSNCCWLWPKGQDLLEPICVYGVSDWLTAFSLIYKLP